MAAVVAKKGERKKKIGPGGMFSLAAKKNLKKKKE